MKLQTAPSTTVASKRSLEATAVVVPFDVRGCGTATVTCLMFACGSDVSRRQECLCHCVVCGLLTMQQSPFNGSLNAVNAINAVRIRVVIGSLKDSQVHHAY